MDVVTPEQARIAEEAGACAVMALERVPSDIRAAGGVARMSRVDLIEDIMRTVTTGIRRLTVLRPEELMAEAKLLGAPYELVKLVAESGRLPVPNFAAGGIATPADAALMMALGAESVFVGSGIFKSSEPATRAKAIVRATTHWQDPKVVAEVSRGLGEAMAGLETAAIPEGERLATRGW